MKWVDTACARATQWLEKRVFDDDEGAEGGKAGLAEKGYANGGNSREHAQPLLNGGEARVPPP